MKIGYARVSSSSQDTTIQEEALKKEGESGRHYLQGRERPPLARPTHILPPRLTLPSTLSAANWP